MQITPEQAEQVRAWASEGASLSDIQTRLADEFGVRLSYLDTRFLLIDLRIDLAEKPEKKPAPDLSKPSAGDYDAAPPLPGGGAEGPDAAAYPDESDLPDDPEPPEVPGAAPDPDAAPGAVKVEMERIQRPGFAASGRVTWSDGVSGDWGIDAYGRLALSSPDHPGYRPAPADQRAFMDELRRLLSAGY